MSLADKFNLLNEMNILRIICGAFFIPHIYAKFMVPEALGFFVAAKFNPPRTWMYVACVIEIVLALALIFGLLTAYAAAATALYMVVICAAIYKVTGKYLWNIGGFEYPLFWGISCLVVAMHAWKAM